MQAVKKSGKPIAEVQKEAKAIVGEMGHTFTMNAIKAWVISLSKAAKPLFDGIYVNKEGVQMVS